MADMCCVCTTVWRRSVRRTLELRLPLGRGRMFGADPAARRRPTVACAESQPVAPCRRRCRPSSRRARRPASAARRARRPLRGLSRRCPSLCSPPSNRCKFLMFVFSRFALRPGNRFTAVKPEVLLSVGVGTVAGGTHWNCGKPFPCFVSVFSPWSQKPLHRGETNPAFCCPSNLEPFLKLESC